MENDQNRPIIIVKGGGAGSVFGGLLLFFVVLPLFLTIGCLAFGLGTADPPKADSPYSPEAMERARQLKIKVEREKSLPPKPKAEPREELTPEQKKARARRLAREKYGS